MVIKQAKVHYELSRHTLLDGSPAKNRENRNARCVVEVPNDLWDDAVFK